MDMCLEWGFYTALGLASLRPADIARGAKFCSLGVLGMGAGKGNLHKTATCGCERQEVEFVYRSWPCFRVRNAAALPKAIFCAGTLRE
jgi:hypothetical protein